MTLFGTLSYTSGFSGLVSHKAMQTQIREVAVKYMYELFLG